MKHLKELEENAERLLRAGDQARALELYHELCSQAPHNALAWHRQGLLLERKGDMSTAEQCQRQALAIAPGYADAWHALGKIRQHQGYTGDALHCHQRALTTAPRHRGALLALLEHQLCQNRLEQAEILLQRILQRPQGVPRSLHHLATRLHNRNEHQAVILLFNIACGVMAPRLYAFLILADSLHQSGRTDEAIKLLQEFEDTKASYDAGIHLAAIYRQRKEYTAAEYYLRKVAAEWPDEAKPVIELSRTLLDQGKTQDAQRCLEHFIKTHPVDSAALVESGYQCFLRGDYEQAGTLYRKALSVDPDCAAALCNMGQLHQLYGRQDEAETCLRKALELEPGLLAARCNLAFCLNSRGHYDKAIAHYQAVLDKKPDFEPAIAGTALALERQGRTQEALQKLAPLIQAGTGNIHTLMAYARTCSINGDEARAAGLLEQTLNTQQLPKSERMQACFLLGRLHDRIGNYQKAFDWYTRGNDMHPVRFDRESHARLISALQTAFSSTHMAHLPRASNNSRLPVFIVGMPRSGTTLTEQIIASHPQAFGAGELTHIRDIANALPGLCKTGKPFPLGIPEITTEALDPIAERHLDYLASLDRAALRIVDKLPSNFMLLGLIELLFPNARILHCVRDPVDTCLSCYFQQFASGQHFSYRQSDLAFYYRHYRKVMAHWEQVLSIQIMEVRYEQLVQDQEQTSRRIFDFIGLDWDPRCLDFHQSDRKILTASYEQVRKPIYRSSLRRRENYREQLATLIEELGGYTKE